MAMRGVRMWWPVKSGLVLLLVLMLFAGQSPAGDRPMSKLDPLLRMLLLRNQEALARTGEPLNLAPFASIVGVYSDSRPILLPERVSAQALIGLTADRVGVIIRTDSVAKLRALGIEPRTILDKIVTARVTLAQLERLLALPEVIHIEAARKLGPIAEKPEAIPTGMPSRLLPELDVSMPETNANTLQGLGVKGAGVIVGIVDSGIDYDHKDFRTGGSGEPSSRILYIWDQTCGGIGQPACGPGAFTPPFGYDYGGEYDKADIESDIANGYGPEAGLVREADTDGHGSHVAGIAAGDGSSSGSGYIGMAPEADIIAVKTTFSFDDVIDGVNYILQRAVEAGKPAVVNLSLGSHYGPHDGTSQFEAALDSLVSGAGRVIVAAAGNEGNDYIHAAALLNPGGYSEITFYAQPGDDLTDAYAINCWYGDHPFTVTVTSPNGHSFSKASGESAGLLNTPDGGVYLDNASGGLNPNNGAKELEVEILGSRYGFNNIASGTWTIRVKYDVLVGIWPYGFDCWFYYNQGEPFTSANANNDMSVGAPATANEVIAAGAYVTKRQWTDIDGNSWWYPSYTVGAIAPFSSRGPTRDGRQKPEIAGPGVVIGSALAKETDCLANPDCRAFVLQDGEHRIMQGTSMSCPHTAGGVALLLQQDPSLTASQVKSRLQGDAKTDGYTGPVPNYTWGYGKLQITQLTPAGTEAAFRVTKEGEVYADRAYFCGLSQGCFNTGTGADIAESIRVSEPVEPGDLVELDPTRPGLYRKTRTPYSALVAGVISTAPGIIMGGRGSREPPPLLQLSLSLGGVGASKPSALSIASIAGGSHSSLKLSLQWTVAEVLAELGRDRPLLALMGVVPVKATAEKGPIRPGDLLTSAPRSGHVMRCDARELERCRDAIIGKALEPLEKETGIILMLIMR